MPRKKWDPTSPETVERMLEDIRNTTREEWLKSLAWRPEGVEETWRLAKDPEIVFPEFATDSAGRVVGPNPRKEPLPPSRRARKVG